MLASQRGHWIAPIIAERLMEEPLLHLNHQLYPHPLSTPAGDDLGSSAVRPSILWPRLERGLSGDGISKVASWRSPASASSSMPGCWRTRAAKPGAIAAPSAGVDTTSRVVPVEVQCATIIERGQRDRMQAIAAGTVEWEWDWELARQALIDRGLCGRGH